MTVFLIIIGISLLIVVFNYILRTIIIGLVNWVGKKTFS
jgi:hypothetical protein